jgi:hypothetical protein
VPLCFTHEPLRTPFTTPLLRYDHTQTETRTIASVTPGAGGTTVLGLTAPLAFSHTSVVVDGHVMAAGVGLVTRAITVTGHDYASSGWGAHVVVGQLLFDDDLYTGRLTAQGVQFVGVGKLGSEHPAVLFQVSTAGIAGLNQPLCREGGRLF